MEREHWRIGELAAATGLTVRALRHYDEVGVLVPAQRTAAGYRLYGQADVRRLYRIVALRRLGLALEEVARLLDGGGPDLAETVCRQLRVVERQLAESRRLRDRLKAIQGAIERDGVPSMNQLIETMEAMTMHEKYYTAEQLARLQRRREQLGEQAIEDAQREWEQIFAALRAAQREGTDPSDSRLDPQRQRARDLLRQFTGGDADIMLAMNEMWTNEDPEEVSHGMIDRELGRYVVRVFATPSEA